MARVFLRGAAAGLGAPASQPRVGATVPPPPSAHVPSSGTGFASLRATMTHSPPMDDVEFINPHFIKSVWMDIKLRKRCGLLLLLPSAVTNLGMLKSKVLPDGQTYRLDILIPDAVSNPDKFLLFIRAYPGALEESGGEKNAALRETAFQQTMSTMRVAKEAPIWRRFQLVLDFPVVEDIFYTKVMTLEGCYFLYVEFLAQEKNSYMHGDGMLEGDGVVDLNACFGTNNVKKFG
jgi:hypothetical protein